MVQTFCESCVHFDFTHSSVHMTWRFVIQGCPTLCRMAQTYIDIKQNLHHIADEVLGLLQLHETISSRWNYNDQKQLQERCTLLTQVCPRIIKQLTSHNQILFIVYLSFQLWTVALCLTQPMAKLVTLLEQHWD